MTLRLRDEKRTIEELHVFGNRAISLRQLHPPHRCYGHILRGDKMFFGGAEWITNSFSWRRSSLNDFPGNYGVTDNVAPVQERVTLPIRCGRTSRRS
jgi:hypothetical protein